MQTTARRWVWGAVAACCAPRRPTGGTPECLAFVHQDRSRRPKRHSPRCRSRTHRRRHGGCNAPLSELVCHVRDPNRRGLSVTAAASSLAGPPRPRPAPSVAAAPPGAWGPRAFSPPALPRAPPRRPSSPPPSGRAPRPSAAAPRRAAAVPSATRRPAAPTA